jgi:hypothetical protein
VKQLLLAFIIFFFTSCSNTGTILNEKKAKPNFSDYGKIIIYDLSDNFSRTKKNKKVLDKGKLFSEIVASILIEEEIFDQIEQNKTITNEKALILRGSITKLQEGSKAARSIIGIGKAAACFEAKLDFIDNQSQKLIASISINERTFPLGGIFASLEDLDSLIEAAAEITIDEILQVK